MMQGPTVPEVVLVAGSATAPEVGSAAVPGVAPGVVLEAVLAVVLAWVPAEAGGSSSCSPPASLEDTRAGHASERKKSGLTKMTRADLSSSSSSPC